MIPVNAPVITPESKALVAKALEEGWISSAGPYLSNFEHEFAEYLGVKHAITVNTGTAALHIALLAAGIGVGDEVIVPAFTMAASWMAVMHTGATPIFVDVEPDIYTIDPALIEAAITAKTKAIMPVHIYGHPADMDPILAIAKKHDLVVIEDAAEAHGATYKGKLTGSIGDVNAFSFYANKIITTGEGGMVTTDNDQMAATAGRMKDLAHSQAKRFIHDALGYNYRMTSMQAALGSGQLQHIGEFLATKQHMAKLYEAGLKDIPGLTLPTTRDWATHVYWMYAILIDESKFGCNEFARYCQRDRYCDFFYAPVASSPIKAWGGLPVTIARDGCYLPSGLAITDDQIGTVCETQSCMSQLVNQRVVIIFVLSGNVIGTVAWPLPLFFSRDMGPTEFGLFSAAFAAMQIVVRLSDLGTNMAVERAVARVHDQSGDLADRLMRVALWFKLASFTLAITSAGY
jgi:perosamine synthetase